MDHHPSGRDLPRNIAKSIRGGTESSLSRYASSGMEHNSQKYYKLLNENQETEAAEVRSLDIHMNESSEAYDLRPPNLTNSEYESDSDVESDATERAYLKHLPNTAPGVTDYTKTNEIESGKINLENKHESDILNETRT